MKNVIIDFNSVIYLLYLYYILVYFKLRKNNMDFSEKKKIAKAFNLEALVITPKGISTCYYQTRWPSHTYYIRVSYAYYLNCCLCTRAQNIYLCMYMIRRIRVGLCGVPLNTHSHRMYTRRARKAVDSYFESELFLSINGK